MAWYEMNAGGIPASLKSDMNSVLNKKFGTVSQDYPPNGWPADVNLMGPLPEKTASGAIASFPDGADTVPVKSCKVAFGPGGGGGTPADPVALVGYNNVNLIQTGKNLLKNELVDGNTGGIDYSLNSDGSIACVGTVSNANSTRVIKSNVVLPIGNYVLSGADSSINLRCIVYAKDGTSNNRNDTGSGVTVSVTDDTDYLEFRIKARTNLEEVNTTISPMFEVGSTPTAYVQYSEKTIADSFGQTVYGGEYDFITGVFTETWEKKVYTGRNDEYWVLSKSGDIFRYYVINDNVKQPTGRGVVYSNIGQYSASGNDEGTCFTYYSSGIQRVLIYYIPPQTIQTVEDFRTWLSSNNLEVVYEKATPIEITGLDTHDIETNYADNNFYADIPDSTMTVEYRADIPLALNA